MIRHLTWFNNRNSHKGRQRCGWGTWGTKITWFLPMSTTSSLLSLQFWKKKERVFCWGIRSSQFIIVKVLAVTGLVLFPSWINRSINCDRRTAAQIFSWIFFSSVSSSIFHLEGGPSCFCSTKNPVKPFSSTSCFGISNRDDFSSPVSFEKLLGWSIVTEQTIQHPSKKNVNCDFIFY